VNGFVGRYEHQLDEKGRVSLPAPFRREAEDDRFVLLQWEKPYLTLFPGSVWEGILERLVEYRRSDPEAWNHVRGLMANAVEVVPDKQGRILIPSWLQRAAGLEGSVLLNGNIDRVEIWDPEEYHRVVEEPSGDFEKYSRQIFG